jgi:2-keto-3-deoxy-L-rhamnonate aldolase RhmA
VISTRARKRPDAGQPAWGLFINMSDSAVTEIAGHAGHDFAIVDMEHTALDFQTVENLLRAAANAGLTGIVRVPENNPRTILRACDRGADGGMVPHVLSADKTRRAVNAGTEALERS